MKSNENDISEVVGAINRDKEMAMLRRKDLIEGYAYLTDTPLNKKEIAEVSKRLGGFFNRLKVCYFS